MQPSIDLNDTLAQSIISFFFLPNYHRKNGVPVIVLRTGKSGTNSAFISDIKQRASKHGYTDIMIIDTESPDARSLPADPQEARSVYRQLLRQPGMDVQSLLIDITTPSAPDIIERIIEEEEQYFEKEDSMQYRQKMHHKELENQLKKQQQLLAAAEAELSNQSNYVDFIRSGSQAAELQQFYNNEYEILPKWYKRFGHLLKVIMGKRSAKSLFNDNIKKYKS